MIIFYALPDLVHNFRNFSKNFLGIIIYVLFFTATFAVFVPTINSLISTIFFCNTSGLILAPIEICYYYDLPIIKGLATLISLGDSAIVFNGSSSSIESTTHVAKLFWKYGLIDGNALYTVYIFSMLYAALHPLLFLRVKLFDELDDLISTDLNLHEAPAVFRYLDGAAEWFQALCPIFAVINIAVILNASEWQLSVMNQLFICGFSGVLLSGLFYVMTFPAKAAGRFAEPRYTHALNEQMSKKIASKTDFMKLEESLLLEFKTTFQTPYPNQPQEIKDKSGKAYFTLDGRRRFQSLKEIEKLLQEMVLEAVVGFLNSSGGHLVIGINEKDNQKNLVGIEYEQFESEDVYERNVIQHIINRIGKEFMGDYITCEFQKHENKTLFVIAIKAYIPKKGQIPALLDGTKCFKRTGPRTDMIEQGAEFASFVANRTL